ncbi:MAG: hypothetical protein QOJ21_3002, partial [Solirubrobacteraceae bacterium]|nr:hypothetical protein [Solirubrobacteraceae bacterium]
EMAERVERLALHGLSVGAWQRFSDAGFKHYEVEEPGYKYNMTDVQAALGIHQLPQLDGWIDRRAELASRYDDLLADLPLDVPPPADPNARHAQHLYPVFVRDEAGISRNSLLEALVERKIGTGVHYHGVHLHPYYRDRYAIAPEALPVTTDMSARTLSLPLSPKVTESDQDDVVDALAEVLAGAVSGTADRAIA